MAPTAERFFIESGADDEPRLEAVLHPPRRTPVAGVVVCHPHPLYGGDMDSHVVTGLCEALASDGVAAFRFNFRGSGASTGRHENGIGERADALRALAVLGERPEVDARRLGIAGYSFGAVVASAIADPARARFLVSPPALLDGPQLPTLVVTGADDQVAPPFSLAQTGVQVEVIPGVDHFWMSGLDQLAESAKKFFRDTLA